jgi:hypothetical protein
MALCERISPVPEVGFAGPVDGGLDPARAARLVQTLRDALEVISSHATPGRVTVSTSAIVCTAKIETAK